MKIIRFLAFSLALAPAVADAFLSNTINANNRTIHVQTATTGNFISLADMQAVIAQRNDLTRAAVLTGENADNLQTTIATELANNGNPAKFTLGIAAGTLRYSRNDAAVALGATSGGRFGLLDASNTFNLGSTVAEGVSHFGAMFYNYLSNGTANLVRVTATFDDASTAVYDATAGSFEYTFVGFAAPAGRSIVSVKIDEVSGGGWMCYDDLTIVLAKPPVLTGSSWTGLGANDLWSTAANWSNPPSPGTALIFADAPDGFSENDLAPGIAYEDLTITAEAVSYVIEGNSINPGGAIRSFSPLLQVIDLPLQLTEETTIQSVGTLDLGGDLAGAGGITKISGGALHLRGENSQTGANTLTGGSVELFGDNTAANGGWSVGPNALNPTTLAIREGAALGVAADGKFVVGTDQSGTAAQTVDVFGEVVCDGLLEVLRPGTLNLRNQGRWVQNGDLLVQAVGGFSAHLNVLDDAELVYTDDLTIVINPALSSTGSGFITVDGGTITTRAGFENLIGNSTGQSVLTIRNGGSLVFTGDVPDIASGVRMVVGPGDAVVATSGHTVGFDTLVDGGGRLLKSGAGTLVIREGATFQGPSVGIQGGVLSMEDPEFAGLKKIEVQPGASLALSYAGTGILADLVLDGVSMPNGIYGAPGSDAPIESAYLQGSGLLEVSASAQLTSLSLSSGQLSPAFNPAVFDYASAASFTTASTVVTIGAAAGSSVTVNGEPLSSSGVSQAIDLEIGETIITIATTSSNGSAQETYTLTVTRAPQPGIIWDSLANRVVSVDFEAYAPDAIPVPPFLDLNALGLRNVRDDSFATPFGTDNQFLQLGNPNLRLATSVPSATWGGTATVAFDLFEPSGIGTSPIIFGLGALAGGNPEINATGGVFAFNLNNGNLTAGPNTVLQSGAMPSLSVDRAYRMVFLLNRDAVGSDYESPAAPGTYLALAPDRMALWVYDVAAETWLQGPVLSTTNTAAASQWVFRSFSNGDNQIYVDNFQILDVLSALPPRTPPLWTGEGANALWSTPGNWLEGLTPLADAPIRFAADTGLDAINDLAPDFRLGPIEFDAAGGYHVLDGNRISLRAGVFNGSSQGQALDMDLLLESGTVALSTSAGALDFMGAISGTGGISKQGTGFIELAGINSYAGGTSALAGTLSVTGSQAAATGGWSISPQSAATTTVFFAADADIVVAADREIRIGNNVIAGAGVQTLTVQGSVVNAGAFFAGRRATVNLQSGAVWNQNGPATVAAIGVGSAEMNISADAHVVYAATSPFVVNAALAPNVGNATINLAGGTFTTGVGFVRTTETGSGISGIVLSNGGSIVLSADVPQLATDVVVTLGGGNGVISTGGFNASIAAAPVGIGGLTKTGGGTLTLQAGPAYAGDTTVAGGNLVLLEAGFDDASTVSIATGATIGLEFSGSDEVASLVLGGIAQAPGTYSATSHPTFFIGAGALVVAGSPSSGFAAWAESLGLTGDPDADFDQDGLSDLLEYALAGLDPKLPDGSPGSLVDGVISFSKRELAVANGDVTYVIEISTDLGGIDPWTAVTPDVNDAATISFTLPPGAGSLFARLRVTVAAP